MGQTVNLLAMPSVVRIHHHPLLSCGNSSVDRALAFQAGGRGFESRFPLTNLITLYHRDAEVGSTESFSVGWGEN